MSGGALLKSHIFCPKTTFFGPKRPRNRFKTEKQTEMAATLNVRLDFLMTRSALLPSRATACPRNWLKMAQILRRLCQTSPPKKTKKACILIYMAQIPNVRAPPPPATTSFLSFPSLRITQRDA